MRLLLQGKVPSASRTRRLRSERLGPGSYLKHVAGKGGTEIRVESFSGRIDLQQR